MAKTYYVYIMSNKSRRLYVGMTSELIKRVRQHKTKYYASSFPARYCFDLLAYFEAYSNPDEAIRNEKQLKGWRREKKLKLILAENPDWADLSARLRGPRNDNRWRVERAKPKSIPLRIENPLSAASLHPAI